MSKTSEKSHEEVQSSVTSIYASLLKKRQVDREKKMEEKRIEKEEKEAQKEIRKAEKEEEEGIKLSRKERREKAINNWKDVVQSLTGDDLDYIDEKPKKKKYKKWIDDEETNTILMAKPKKAKKKNYNKEFEAELNMLKALVTEQNKFTQDLQKRYQISAGPNTKDAMPLTKTQVELASAINASRSNSLGVLREIGNVKKTIADLYMKQKKLDADLGTSGMNSTTDLGLMGSNIAASLFGDSSPVQSNPYSAPSTPYTSNTATNGYQEVSLHEAPQSGTSFASAMSSDISSASGMEEFNPETWDDNGSIEVSPNIQFENIPHDIVVEWKKNEDKARFKAVRRDNGEELVGCPVPTSDPARLSFNEKDLTVKGQFDEVYKLEVV